jgi:primase-polymerase (primpol)-like protein
MTDRIAWVRADGKRPITLTGTAASSTDSAGWAGFGEVVAAPVGDGYGVMLGGGLACWDLDHCFEDGRLSEEARAVLDGIDRPLWVERSVSGEGLHVFVEAVEGKGWKRGGVEFYSRARFIRVTGEAFTIPARS